MMGRFRFFSGVLTLFLATGSFGGAGDTKGNGGGTLARLLSYAHRELVSMLPTLRPNTLDFKTQKLAKWYADNFVQMNEDIKGIRFVPMNEKISDSYYGYESWIRLNTTSGFIVEYNPDVTVYQKLVGMINPRYRVVGVDQDATPSILDVTEYLLHEVGHKYGLNEQDAWEFAQALIKHFRFTREIMPIECRMHITGESPETDKSLTLDSAHPSYSFNIGKFGVRLELDERRYETVWVLTEESMGGIYMINHMISPAGMPFSGQAMVRHGIFVSIYCK